VGAGSRGIYHLRTIGHEGLVAMSGDVDTKNKRLVLRLVLVAVFMFGFGYALVPLYDVLCDLAGQNIRVENASTVEGVPIYAVDTTREVAIELITSINGSTPLTFRAEKATLKVHPGQYETVNFYAKNTLNTPIKAQAIPSISPGLTEEFFKKVQCFCFTTQTFAPKEEKIMPVRFVVDPKLPERYKTITLSYTFFDRTNTVDN
jgi:cytochrome c oxidase assembly protein subunit 11